MPATPKDLVGCAGFWNLDSLVQHWVRWDCLESYHVECVGKDESFVESGNSWTCKWHSCFICRKSSKFHCFCCLKAVCEHRIATAEFARVRRNKGFCNHYLKFALLQEENMDVDSDGKPLDGNLYDILFFKRLKNRGDGSDLKTQQCSEFKQSSKSETTNPITTRNVRREGNCDEKGGKIQRKGVVMKKVVKSKGKGVVMKRVVKSKGKGVVMKREAKSKGKGVVMKREAKSKGREL
ncbi:unnamed protein product [Camellia sinensis]